LEIKKIGQLVMIIGSIIGILYVPYSSQIVGEGYSFVLSHRVGGYYIPNEFPILKIIDYKMFLLQLLIINAFGLLIFSIGKTQGK
jgi:hypothetical protein